MRQLSLLPMLTLSFRTQVQENHALMVTNVVDKQIEQRAEITYDVSDTDSDLMTMKLLAFSDRITSLICWSEAWKVK